VAEVVTHAITGTVYVKAGCNFCYTRCACL